MTGVTGVTGVIAASSVSALGFQSLQTPRRFILQEDPGIAYTLTAPELEKGAALLRQVFTPFLGEWVGSREGRDTGSTGPVLFTKNYTLLAGGPQVIAHVEANVAGLAVFAAAKAYAYSPLRDTLITYFFESGGHVQMFELDRKAMDSNRLVWNEIMRKGPAFRAEESIPNGDEFTSTIYQQDSSGVFRVFASNVLRRRFKESIRRQKINN